MAKKAGISHSSVGRIWRAHGLKPHIVRGFKLSNDPQFIEKVRDIVGLYMNPPEHAVVFSFDEKPQIQALERAQGPCSLALAMGPCSVFRFIQGIHAFASTGPGAGSVSAVRASMSRVTASSSGPSAGLESA